ncbi:unnamed protein product [Sympodiomycopsis kandeliae]
MNQREAILARTQLIHYYKPRNEVDPEDDPRNIHGEGYRFLDSHLCSLNLQRDMPAVIRSLVLDLLADNNYEQEPRAVTKRFMDLLQLSDEQIELVDKIVIEREAVIKGLQEWMEDNCCTNGYCQYTCYLAEERDQMVTTRTRLRQRSVTPAVQQAPDEKEESQIRDLPQSVRRLVLSPEQESQLEHPVKIIPFNKSRCAICLDDFVPINHQDNQNRNAAADENDKEPETLRLLPCQHVLHEECASDLFSYDSPYVAATTCPLCGSRV